MAKLMLTAAVGLKCWLIMSRCMYVHTKGFHVDISLHPTNLVRNTCVAIGISPFVIEQSASV